MVEIRARFCDRLRRFTLRFMWPIIAGIIVAVVAGIVLSILTDNKDNDNLPRIMITAAQFDAPDDDWKNLNDDEKHEYLFPEGFTLAAGENVTVYTGSGNDTQTELYMRWVTPIWNNAGDNTTLKDSNGQVIDRWPPS